MAAAARSLHPAPSAARSGPVPVGSLSDQEYARLVAVVGRETGVVLGPMKKALLVGRLSPRLRALGIDSFGAYRERVEADPAERAELVDRITTHETHFFREPRHFEWLGREVLPRWAAEGVEGRRPRRVRAWSAACSTGEEPFTLAMVLLAAFPPGSGWAIEILATDLARGVLARAEAAEWSLAKAREIPDAYLRFMLRGTGPCEGRLRAGPELRALVRFLPLNLVEPLPDVGTFDLVLCRNVLIYFDRTTKEGVVRRLLQRLDPGGYLLLGGAESLSGSSLPLRTVFPTVYAHAGPGGRG